MKKKKKVKKRKIMKDNFQRRPNKERRFYRKIWEEAEDVTGRKKKKEKTEDGSRWS